MTEPTYHRRRTGRRSALMALAVSLLTGSLLIGLPGTATAALVFNANFEDGTTSAFQLSGGRWTVSSDGSRVLRQTRSGAERAVASLDGVSYTLTARVKATSLSGPRSAVGMVARLNGDSGYHLTLRKGNQVELARVNGTERTVLASHAVPVRTTVWYLLRLDLIGGRLTATVSGPDGSASMSVSEPTVSTGGIALFTERAAASFDDVLVDTLDPPDAEPPSTPDRPQITEVTPTTATITWPAATDNVGVTGYIVYHGSQFYEQYELRRVATNDPVTLPLGSTTGATLHFSVRAVDVAGNQSPIGPRVTLPQPPTFPKTGNDTEPPTAPGAPISVTTGEFGTIITWAPATDNIGVMEYHVIHSMNVDEVRVRAKVPGDVTTAVIPGGSFPNLVRIVAIDASWNRTSGPSVTLTPGPTPPPPPPSG